MEKTEIQIEYGNNQIIVPSSEKKKINRLNEEIQDKYRSAGLYKEYTNRPEERVGELWLYHFFLREMPDWIVYPAFMGLNQYDIILENPDLKKLATIEVKTKPEAPKTYILKHDKPELVDRTAGIPENKIGQILSSNFVFWVMTSKFSIFSDYADSSSQLIGISEKTDTSIDTYTFSPMTNKNTAYYFMQLDAEKNSLKYKGMEGLHEFVKQLNST